MDALELIESLLTERDDLEYKLESATEIDAIVSIQRALRILKHRVFRLLGTVNWVESMTDRQDDRSGLEPH